MGRRPQDHGLLVPGSGQQPDPQQTPTSATGGAGHRGILIEARQRRLSFSAAIQLGEPIDDAAGHLAASAFRRGSTRWHHDLPTGPTPRICTGNEAPETGTDDIRRLELGLAKQPRLRASPRRRRGLRSEEPSRTRSRGLCGWSFDQRRRGALLTGRSAEPLSSKQTPSRRHPLPGSSQTFPSG